MRRKIHLKKNKKTLSLKEKIKYILDNKGFTLVEVLAVVVIIAVISSIGIAIYLNSIKTSEKKATVLATNNVMDAAETYTKEYNSIRWLNTYAESINPNELKITRQYVCITVNELINSGYFKKDFFENKIYQTANITNNSYIKITRDIDNKSDIKVNVLPEVTEYNGCDKSDDSITINNGNLYTDTIMVQYNDTEAIGDNPGTYNAYIKEGNSQVVKQKIELQTNKTGEIEFSNLKSNTKYVVSVCATLDNITKCSHKDIYTKDFVDSTITIDPFNEWSASKSVIIEFKDDNIKGNAKHYFTSEENGTIETGDIYYCSDIEDNISNCNHTTKVTTIEENKWYYTSDNAITIKITKNINNTKKYVHAKVLDPSDNSSNKIKNYVNKIDLLPPDVPTSVIKYISSTGTVRTNADTWTNQTLWWGNFSATDTGGSGIDHYEYSTNCSGSKSGILNTEYTYSSNKNNSYCIRAVDNAGNESEWSSANYFKIDKSAPGIPTSTIRYASSTGTARTNANTWTNQTLWWGNFSATDTGGSGINHYEYSTNCSGSKSGNLGTSYTYSSNYNYSYCIRAIDNAGNTGSWSSANYFKIDKTPPTCSVSGGSSSWTKNNVTVTGTCSDTGGSNCKSNSVSITKTTDTNTSVSPGTVEDNAGNKTTCGTKTVKIDKTAPTTPTYTAKYASSGSTYTSGTWTNSKVNTVISSTDSGSGISNMQYSSDKSSWSNLGFSVSALTKSGTTWTGTEPWSLYNRNHTYYFRACDSVGNCSGSSSKFNVKYDITAPTCTSSKSNTYTTSGVTATFSCSDNSSGVVSCTSKKTGLTSTKSYTIKDSAGNSGTCKVTVNAGTRYRSRTCNTCKRCSSAGCDSWPDWSDYYVYKKRIATSAACTSAKPANTNTYQYICRAPITTYNYTSFYQIHRRTCSRYKLSCASCGCYSWNSWTGYTATSCTPTASKECSSAYVYW